MCLILFAYQQHPDYPLIVCANRDEFYQRPTLAAHWWPEQPQLFAGKDLQAGGTWMGLSLDGRFAAVTNYRSNTPPPSEAISRGSLCTNFLTTNTDSRHYLTTIDRQQSYYAGFNLLLGSPRQLFYYSNRQGRISELRPGLHGLSNGLLNDDWPKVSTGKAELAKQLERGADPEQLLALLQDRSQPDDKDLPDTGIDIETERRLSSRFIQSPGYGTRTSTVLLIDHAGRSQWLEQVFDGDGRSGEANLHHLQLQR
jgi:uncharacterized protein with NRDE domain